MDFSSIYRLKDSKSQFVTIIFYVAVALLIAVVFCYGLFTLKIYLQQQEIAQLDQQLAVYGTEEQKASEKKVLDYKRKIDAFAALMASHKISTNIFAFIEEHTLPTVWFSSIEVSEDRNELSLSGDASSWEELSRQLNVFENNKDYIKGVTLPGASFGDGGKVQFTLKLLFEPKIFTDYQSNTTIVAPVNTSVNVNSPSL